MLRRCSTLPEQLEEARTLAVRPDTLLEHGQIGKLAVFLRWHQRATETLVDLDDAYKGSPTVAGRHKSRSGHTQQRTVKPDPDEVVEEATCYDVDSAAIELEELREIIADGEQCINALNPNASTSGVPKQVDRHPFVSRLCAARDGAEDLAARVRELLSNSLASVSSRQLVKSTCVSIPAGTATADVDEAPTVTSKTFVKREFVFSGAGRLGMVIGTPEPFDYNGCVYRVQVTQVYPDTQAQKVGITVGMWIHSINNNVVHGQNVVYGQQAQTVIQELKWAPRPLTLVCLVQNIDKALSTSKSAPQATNPKPMSLSAFIKQLESLMIKVVSTRVAVEVFEEAQQTLVVARWYKRAALETENHILIQMLDTLVRQADDIQIFDGKRAGAEACIGRQCLTLTPIDEGATVKRNSNRFKS